MSNSTIIQNYKNLVVWLIAHNTEKIVDDILTYGLSPNEVVDENLVEQAINSVGIDLSEAVDFLTESFAEEYVVSFEKTKGFENLSNDPRAALIELAREVFKLFLKNEYAKLMKRIEKDPQVMSLKENYNKVTHSVADSENEMEMISSSQVLADLATKLAVSNVSLEYMYEV